MLRANNKIEAKLIAHCQPANSKARRGSQGQNNANKAKRKFQGQGAFKKAKFELLGLEKGRLASLEQWQLNALLKAGLAQTPLWRVWYLEKRQPSPFQGLWGGETCPLCPPPGFRPC
jgi:hypothetical protein